MPQTNWMMIRFILITGSVCVGGGGYEKGRSTCPFRARLEKDTWGRPGEQVQQLEFCNKTKRLIWTNQNIMESNSTKQKHWIWHNLLELQVYKENGSAHPNSHHSNNTNQHNFRLALHIQFQKTTKI